MKRLLVLFFFATPALAQAPNHLDCYDGPNGRIICPPVVGLEKPVAAPPAKPKSDWNSRCARRFNSFNPKTGLYKSYSGVMKRCDPNLPRSRGERVQVERRKPAPAPVNPGPSSCAGKRYLTAWLCSARRLAQ